MKNKKKHRAVSEIISTLLLLAISVVGASLLSVFISNSFDATSFAQIQDSPARSIQLVSYDTRDNTGLMGITDLDNFYDSKLCAESCPDKNKNPVDGGTEFIVMQIENKNAKSIYPDKIYVNNITYTWDDSTIGIRLEGSAPDSSSNSFPDAGKFSIFDRNNEIQTAREIKGGKTVNILIKLDTYSEDILLDKYFTVKINIGDLNSKEFVLQGGTAQ